MQIEVPVAASHPKRQMLAIGLAVALTVPALALRLSGNHPESWIAAMVFGLAVVGAAFLLAWAAEVLQLDVSAGLALAVLAPSRSCRSTPSTSSSPRRPGPTPKSTRRSPWRT